MHSLFADGNKINSFEDLVVLAKEIFEYLFVFKIHAIFKEHPVDETSENGILFWSGYRKIPKSEEFDLTEEGHMNFIIQTANLFALILNYPQNLKKPALISIIKGAIQNKTRILPNFEEVMEKPEVFIQNLISKNNKYIYVIFDLIENTYIFFLSLMNIFTFCIIISYLHKKKKPLFFIIYYLYF